MGQFSWIASDDKMPVIDNKHADVYLLIPAEFGGGAYHTNYYDGYGNIEVDVYDAVADWNKAYLNHEEFLRKPRLEQWSDNLAPWDLDELEKELGRKATKEEKLQRGKEKQQEYFNNAMIRYRRDFERNKDFMVLSDAEMRKKYGDDYKRIIGIDIAYYDEQNASLPYPIKIVHNAYMSYEQALPSMGDPDQGWGFSYDEDSDFTEEEQAEEYLQNVADEFDNFINNYYGKYKAIGDKLRKGKE